MSMRLPRRLRRSATVLLLLASACGTSTGALESQTSSSPSPSPSSSAVIEGWQTYRDADYGFRIDYPPDWALVDESSEAPKVFDFGKKSLVFVERTYVSKYAPGGVEIWVWEPDVTTLSQWFDKHSASGDAIVKRNPPGGGRDRSLYFWNISNRMSTKVNGFDVIVFDSESFESKVVHHAALFLDGIAMTIELDLQRPENSATYRPIFEKMLGSLRA